MQVKWWRWTAFGIALATTAGVWVLVRNTRRATLTPDLPSDDVIVASPEEPAETDAPDDDSAPTECHPVPYEAGARDAAPCEMALDSEVDALLGRLDAGCGECRRMDRLDVHCVSFNEGDAAVTWTFRPSAPGVDGTSATCEWNASFNLERRWGTARAVHPVSYKVTAGVFTKVDRLTITPVFDYDGDGAREVLVTHETGFFEGHDDEHLYLVGLEGGHLVDYAPASGFSIVSVADFDGDGRPDLWTRGPYARVEAHDVIGNSFPAVTGGFLAHSLPDGTFSTTDAVALQAARKTCPTKPKLSLTKQGLGPYAPEAQTIVCARLWGATEQDVDAVIDAVCPPDAGPDVSTCYDWAKPLAAVVPPFALP